MGDKTINAVNNMAWRFFERCGAQIVTFVVTIILARLLEPLIYGQVALVTVFINILQIFVDSGLGVSLIQKKEPDDLDYSSVFYFNIFICFVLYGLLFISAPFIASFYRMAQLTSVIRVCGLVLIISGVKNVQQAYVSKNMLFKKFFFSTLGGTIGAAVLGIALAIMGYGIWALVLQNVFNQLLDTVILWFTVEWRPKKKFSAKRLGKLLSYGWKLMASLLLDAVYNELRQLIIGKKYSTEDLAYYNQGSKIPALAVSNINSAIDSVLLPFLSDAQNETVRVKAMVRCTIKTSTYLMMPLLVGLCVTAETLVSIVLGDVWLPCVPYLRIFGISYCFYVIHTANLNAIKALGRSGIYFKVEIAKKITGFTVLLSSMWFGVFAMAMCGLLESLLGQIINSWPNKKLINYGYTEQIKDIMPQMLLSAFMGLCVYAAAWIHIPKILTLMLQVLIGIIIYLTGSYMFHIDSFGYILEIIKSRRRKGQDNGK